MISKDKQYRTRDGREVRIYATDGGVGEEVHGAIKAYDGEWCSSMWRHSGWNIYSKPNSDLVEVKPRIKREYWANLYQGEITLHGQRSYADGCAGKTRIACVKVVIDCEEGEGL